MAPLLILDETITFLHVNLYSPLLLSVTLLFSPFVILNLYYFVYFYDSDLGILHRLRPLETDKNFKAMSPFDKF